MTGLLLKDFYTLRQHLKTLGFLLVFFCVLSLGMDNPVLFFEGFFIVMTMMLTIYSFSYDALAKWDIYSLSLPVTRKEIVKSKYLLCLMICMFGTIVSFLLSSMIMLIKPIVDFSFSDNVLFLLAMLSFSILTCSFIIPLIYKFGIEKARFILIAIFALPSASVIILSKFNLSPPSETAITIIIASAPILTIIILFISYLLSAKIFSKKEI